MAAPVGSVAATEGAHVQLLDLRARPELNGRIGLVTGPMRDTGRIPVRIGERGDGDAEFLLLKPCNMKLVSTPPSGCVPEATPTPSLDESTRNTVRPSCNESSTSMPVAVSDDAGAAEDVGVPKLPTSPMWTPPSILGGMTDDACDAVLLGLAVDRALRSSECRGFAPLTPDAWMDRAAKDAAVALGRGGGRGDGAWWDASLIGGTVREVDARTRAGVDAACAAMRARVPVLLRHGARSLAPGVYDELGSVERIGLHLEDEPVSVLHAPPDAAGTFMRFFADKAKHYAHAPRPPTAVNERHHMKWESFVERLTAQVAGERDDGCDYLQYEIAARGTPLHGGLPEMMPRDCTAELLFHTQDALEGRSAPRPEAVEKMEPSDTPLLRPRPRHGALSHARRRVPYAHEFT